VLVDGGAMNNVPANVVREMGADVVIAINVGYMGDKRTVSRSMLGLMGQTVDVMMQANTRIAMRDADIVINPQLEQFGSLDWRRNEALALEGYRAAEALKEKLLPLAVDDREWAAYLAARQARRRTSLETPQFLTIVGAVPSDRERMERVLADRVGVPLDVASLEKALDEFTGLDRYETVGWEMIEENGRYGLRIRARPKGNAPPFLMLGVGLQNLTTDEFAFQLAGRYLTFDALGSGSELRLDAAVGAQPNIAAELYRPIGKTPLFAAAYGGVGRRTVNFIQDDTIVAKYNATTSVAGVDGGVNLGRDNEVRAGFAGGYLRTSIGAGSPDLPELSGPVRLARVRWLHDSQDSPVVPSSGARAIGTITHVFNAPDAPPSIETTLTNDSLTQAEIDGSVFWSLRSRRDRFFVSGGAGTSFDGHPLPNAQFEIGRPLRLSAYDLGEFRGNHYAVGSAGYLRGVGRLPDFMGGPIFLGGWVETGSAFNDIDDARLRADVGLGAVLDTLVGPTILGASVAVDGNWRFYVGAGRLF
jgi:NTE family protein